MGPSDPGLIGDASGDYSEPTWSPDGTKIAFTFGWQVWVADAKGNGARRITGGLFTRAHGEHPTWLSDGRLAYVETTRGEKSYSPREAIYVHDVVTNRRERVMDGLNPIYSLRGHPLDPHTVLVIMTSSSDVRSPGDSGVYLLDTQSGDMRLLPEIGQDRQTKRAWWFPNGSRLAIVKDKTLRLLDLETGLATTCPFDQGNVATIALSPDGQWIAYRRSGGREENYAKGLYIIPADCLQQPKELARLDPVHLDWSPDGSTLMFTTVGYPGKNQLRLLPIRSYLPDVARR